MFRGTDVVGSDSGGAAPDPPAGTGGPHAERAGALDSLLSDAPSFRTRVHGYDRLQVDNYVTWAESELATARRQFDDLMARYGVCSAELEISRRLLAQAPKGVDFSSVSDRVRDILRLASDEATAMIEAGREEADHLLAEARVEGDARLRKAQQIREQAAETVEEMLAQARRERTEAVTVLERAQREAAEAAAERDRLTREAAEAHERLVAVQAELDDLRRQRDDAGTSLRRLNDGIGEALAVLTGGKPDQYLLVDNHVADTRVESLSS